MALKQGKTEYILNNDEETECLMRQRAGIYIKRDMWPRRSRYRHLGWSERDDQAFHSYRTPRDTSVVSTGKRNDSDQVNDRERCFDRKYLTDDRKEQLVLCLRARDAVFRTLCPTLLSKKSSNLSCQFSHRDMPLEPGSRHGYGDQFARTLQFVKGN